MMSSDSSRSDATGLIPALLTRIATGAGDQHDGIGEFDGGAAVAEKGHRK
jgi:hypothetical protein